MPPVWSKCQCVFSTNFTGLGVIAAMAAVIFAMNSFHGTSVIWRSTLFFLAHSWAKATRASSLALRNW